MKCSKCKVDKPKAKFTRRLGSTTGCQAWCKACKRKANNPDKMRMWHLMD